jgi:hypothetical protein
MSPQADAVLTSMTILRAAFRQQGYLQVLFHSRVADKVNMKVLLDSIAEFRDQGLITFVSSSVGLACSARQGSDTGRQRRPALEVDERWSPREPQCACVATGASLDSAWLALNPGGQALADAQRSTAGHSGGVGRNVAGSEY